MTLNIKVLRRNAGLTQKALAERVGVHPNTLAQWERGVRSPSSPKMNAIRDACSNGDTSRVASAPSIGSKDPLYNKIREELQQYAGNPTLFEACCVDLLRPAWPNLTPVIGGKDSGFDGRARVEGDPASIPLIATTARDSKRNLASNLAKAKQGHPRISKAIFATSKGLTAPMHEKLTKVAEDAHVQLLQIYDGEALALLLYHDSRWRKDLLGITGNAPALSRIPMSPRLGPGKLVGREAALDWFKSSNKDCVMVGVPGSGKTALMQELARQDRAFFMVEERRDALADAIRDLRPKWVIVDDAHLPGGWLKKLVQVRSEIDASFGIVATCWPTDNDVEEINHQLGRPQGGADITLGPLAENQILEVVKDAGIHGPNPLLHTILQQAKGRPGLAVTLASACLSGDVSAAVRGAALLKHLGVALEWRIGPEVKELLAAFAVGGERGMSIRKVAEYDGSLSVLDLRTKLTCLTHAGIVAPTHGDHIVVDPPQLRWQLVCKTFLGVVPGEDDLRHLVRVAPSDREATRTLIGAYACGAPAFRMLCEALRHHDDIELWAEFAETTKDAAIFTMEQFPERMERLIATSALQSAPHEALRRIFRQVGGGPTVAHFIPDDEFGWIRSWVSSVPPHQKKERMERRRILMDEADQWVQEGGCPHAVVEFMCAAMIPIFEDHDGEPGYPRRITLWRDTLSTLELGVMAGWWSRVFAAICESVACQHKCPWDTIMSLVGDWTTSTGTEKKQRKLMSKTVAKMLRDLAPLTSERPGWRSTLLERAKVAGVQVQIPAGDSKFDTLYPPNSTSCSNSTLKNRARALARVWAKRHLREVEDLLERVEREASAASRLISYAWDFCSEIAVRRTEYDGRTVVALIERGLSAEVVDAFLRISISQGRRGWQEALAKCLTDHHYAHIAVAAVLAMRQPPAHLLEGAVEVGALHSDVVQRACLRGEVAKETLRTILMSREPALAASAAVGHWRAERQGEVEPSLETEWRNAIISTASLEDDFWGRGGGAQFWIGEILASDGSLAADWLDKLFRILPVRVPSDIVVRAFGKLATAHRCLLIRRLDRSDTLSDFAVDYLDWLPALVGRDIEAFKALLGARRLRSWRLAPLAQFDRSDVVWRNFATAVLDRKGQPEAVAKSSFRGSTGDRLAAFRGLVDDPDARISEIARRGLESCSKEESMLPLHDVP